MTGTSKGLPDLHTQVAVEDHHEPASPPLAPALDDHEESEDHEPPSPDTPKAHKCADSPESEEDEKPPVADVEHAPSISSRVSSVHRVPISDRSGLFSRLSLVYEARNPKSYPNSIKWLLTFWISIAAAAAPMGSSVILPALGQITAEYRTTPTTANLSVALYMLAMSIFPLWWSSASELYGRRTVYVLAFALYTVFNVLAAVSTSIGMFIAMRLLSGGTSAAVQAVGAGTIADIWDVSERGRAMGIFYLGPLCGPLISPVIGGGLTQGLGWRSTQYFQVIFGGIVLIGILLCVPETHLHRSPPALSRTASATTTATRASVQSAKVYTTAIARFLVEPFKLITYLRFPAVFLTVYYASISFGSLYFLNISVESTFSRAPYNFSEIIVGCLYMFNSVGYFISSILGGRWVDAIMHREARRAGRYDEKGRLVFVPTDRMKENVWTAAVMMPAALIWYGWTAHYGVYFLAPMAANFVFGVGSMLLFGAATTMLTELMPKNASSGVALNNFVRNIFAFVGSFTADLAIQQIGNGWLFTILGLVALVSGGLVVWALGRWGERWKEEMDAKL